MGHPFVKKLPQELTNSYLQLEAYQKYWALWIFSGGDQSLITRYHDSIDVKDVPPSDCLISLQRFGFLLIWFGHFSTFLNDIYQATQRGIIFEDTFTSVSATEKLREVRTDIQRDMWLFRCSPKRETPYTLSFVSSIQPSGHREITHQRILFNAKSRLYTFQNLHTRESITSDSIISLVEKLQIIFQFGQPITNTKIQLLLNPVEVTRYV